MQSIPWLERLGVHKQYFHCLQPISNKTHVIGLGDPHRAPLSISARKCRKGRALITFSEWYSWDEVRRTDCEGLEHAFSNCMFTPSICHRGFLNLVLDWKWSCLLYGPDYSKETEWGTQWPGVVYKFVRMIKNVFYFLQCFKKSGFYADVFVSVSWFPKWKVGFESKSFVGMQYSYNIIYHPSAILRTAQFI